VSSPARPTAQPILAASKGRVPDPRDPHELLEGIRIEARRGGPPPEVLAQMRRASLIYEHLQAGGLHLSFEAPDGGEPVITVRGADGEALRTISALEAGDIAVGLASI
jgi:hypothetical protein